MATPDGYRFVALFAPVDWIPDVHSELIGVCQLSDADQLAVVDVNVFQIQHTRLGTVRPPVAATERQASAGARDGVKGNGTISLRALRCMR